MDKKYSIVNIREPNQQKKVEITSINKPKLFENVIDKWQSLIDLSAKVANVPSGLIMKLNTDTIEVFLKSMTEGNPYEKGDKGKLIYGLYCETVIGKQKKLLVPDATKSTGWKDNNPDIDLNMISYLGFPLNWPDGEVFGTVCLLDNKENSYNETITNLLFNLKQHIETDLKLIVTQQELENANEKLNEMNVTKDKFFAIISHDLKASFNSMLGFSEILENDFEKYSTEQKKKFNSIIHKEHESTLKLLENLLDWSRSQWGIIDFNPETLNLKLLSEKTIAKLNLSAEGKKIKIKNEIHENVLVEADSDLLSTIIRNLISNAIKFTPKGGNITLGASHKNFDDTQFIEIKVIDTGVGLAKEKLPVLFDIGEDNSTKGTENEKGTGLGLMLCKEFVEKQGGEIWVESEIGKGSSFCFTIPDKTKNNK